MSNCGCSGGAPKFDAPAVVKSLNLEILYVDINTCDRCQGTDAALEAALADVAPALAALDTIVELRRTLVGCADEAERLLLLTSPTIRVGGVDIQDGFGESACSACGAIAGGSTVDCREWSWHGKSYTAPPKGMIVEALLRTALDGPPPAVPGRPYVLPENLKAFFAGKAGPSGSTRC